MLLWSYFATFLTDPGRVPPGWHPFPSDAEAQAEEAALAEERGNPLGPWRSGGGSGGGGGAGSWQQYQKQYDDPSAGRAFLDRPRFCKKCKVRSAAAGPRPLCLRGRSLPARPREEARRPTPGLGPPARPPAGLEAAAVAPLQHDGGLRPEVRPAPPLSKPLLPGASFTNVAF